MIILHVYKDYAPVLGGIENHVQVLAEAQARAGHDVRVLVCGRTIRSGIRMENGVQVIRAGRLATAASMPLSIAQPLFLAGRPCDVVHLHSPYPLGEAANWLVGRARATVITHHADVIRQKNLLKLYGPIYKRVLRSADRIIATSPVYIDTSPWLRPIRDKCVVVPLGVDTDVFSPNDSGAVGPELLFVGRCRYYKDLGTLLRSLQLVPEARLTVLGDGPMRKPWEEQSRDLGLSDRVRFEGEVPDPTLPQRYRQAGIFVLPANSRAEAFGTVLLEAMGSGLPCVTTEVGSGTSWVVQHEATGLVVPPADPPALAAALRRLLQSPQLRHRMGRAGRERALRIFRQDQMLCGVDEVYRAALAPVEIRKAA